MSVGTEPSSIGLQASTFPFKVSHSFTGGQVYSKDFLNAGDCPAADGGTTRGACPCTLLGCTTPQQVLTGARWGVVQKKCRYHWTLENCPPTLGSWLGWEALCLRGAVCLSDRVTQSLPLGGRDAPARKDAVLRGLNQVSVQLESWCPGSTDINCVVLSSCGSSLHPVPHSPNTHPHLALQKRQFYNSIYRSGG